MGIQTINGRRGPRKKIIDRFQRYVEKHGRLREETYEVLECGHLRRVYTISPDITPISGKRHCLECVRGEEWGRERWKTARTEYEEDYR